MKARGHKIKEQIQRNIEDARPNLAGILSALLDYCSDLEEEIDKLKKDWDLREGRV